MALAPHTKMLLRQLFWGKRCKVCGFRAQRLRAGIFYCHDHLPVKRETANLRNRCTVKTAKDPHLNRSHNAR